MSVKRANVVIENDRDIYECSDCDHVWVHLGFTIPDKCPVCDSKPEITLKKKELTAENSPFTRRFIIDTVNEALKTGEIQS